MENNSPSLSLIVFIVLITLKLSGVIDWSWWLITLPLWWWIPFVILVIIFALVIVLFEKILEKKRDNNLYD
jgi:hypothetical protein